MKIKKILFCLGAVFLHALLPVLAHDSHKGLQHWEIPSVDPDRIVLTFHGDPATVSYTHLTLPTTPYV